MDSTDVSNDISDDHYQSVEKHEHDSPRPYPSTILQPHTQATKGESSSQREHANSPDNADDSLFRDLDPAAERLARDTRVLSNTDFYILMGLREPTSRTESMKDLAVPHGLYSVIQKQTDYTNRKFKMFDIATYALLSLQVLLSAIFIILGALNNADTHLAIAILGAVAAVVAGVLALMKGQGLPNRLRQERDGLRNVIFEAEELFWDFKSGRTILFRDIVKIREAYMKILEQARRNHPDVWTALDDIEKGTGAAKPGAKHTVANR